MKPAYKFLLCMLAFVTAGSCSAWRDEILEAKDVQFFKVEELPGSPPTKLRVSGLAFKSAMSVNKITTETKGDALTVLVHLFLAKPGTSGNFQYDLTVPDTVGEVKFGSDEKLVWKRGSPAPQDAVLPK